MLDPTHVSRAAAEIIAECVDVDVSIGELRAFLDGDADLPERFETELDNAQGHVFCGAPVAYVIVRVTG